MTSTNALNEQFRFLQGGGEMGQLIREYPWETTSVGSPVMWPQCLKTTLGILVNSKFPMFLCWGPEHICFYNDAYRPSLGNEGKHPSILGKPAVEAWIKEGLSGGKSAFMEDHLLPIYRNGGLEDVYWTCSFSPVMDESCEPVGVLVICTETTQKVALMNNLLLSEQRFQTLVKDATVGIIAFAGEDWKVEIVNVAYGKLVGKTVDEMLAKPIFDISPDAEAHFKPVLEKVKSSGKPLYFYEYPYTYHDGGEQKGGYLNLIYQPYRETSGAVKGVIVLCQDVTEQVIGRKATETALEQMRLSKEAAKLGTFDMDLVKGTMEWDRRCRILFGISHDGEVTYEKDFVPGLHPEDRERITHLIDKLFIRSESNGDYDVEYRTVGMDDQKLRWVRAKGKVYFDKNDNPQRFIGSVLEITNDKLEEFRKNDFVGIVSHELKTPLTTLNGLIQIADLKLKGHEDKFLKGAMKKAMVQVKKMNNMITGFLNLSRFEAGNIHLDMLEFSLTELIHTAVEDLLFTTTINITVADCANVVLYGDMDKIECVVKNFLTNAIKYSAKGKQIIVNCDICGEEAIVSVNDQGFGIKEEDLENVFERYYRVENTSTKHISGFGVGLYLSAEIIRLHKGRIWATSEIGQGSTFYFALPLQA